MALVMSVLIVGAGPTGLVLACGLLAVGVAVRIIDAADGPATTSRALGLQPRGVEVLDRIGALADLPERSVEIGGSVVYVRGEEKVRLVLPRGSANGARPALVISQAEIEAQLRERVTELGGRIEWGRELAAAEQDGGGVTGLLADGRHVRADWLVGCDGAHSNVRRSAGIRLVGDTAAERFLLADVHVDLPVERGFASMWAGDDGTVAAVPLPGPNRWRIMAPTPAGEPDEMPGSAVLAVMAELLENTSATPRRRCAMRSGRRPSAFTAGSRMPTGEAGCSWPAMRRTSTARRVDRA